MTHITPKTATLVITVASPLTKEQRESITASVRDQLPADMGVIIMDRGITYELISTAP